MVLETTALPTKLSSFLLQRNGRMKKISSIWYVYTLEIIFRSILLILSWLSVVVIFYLYKKVLLNAFIGLNESLILNFSKFKPHFILTEITEIFNVYFYLIFFFSNQIFFLKVGYHILMFLSKSVSKKEGFFLVNSFKIIVIFWVISFVFLNIFILPLTWDFFFSFYKDTHLNSLTLFFELRLIEYVKFYFSLYYTSFFIGQFLALIFLVFKSGITSVILVRKYRKLFYLVIVSLSTVLSPPDIFYQLFISFLIIIFFEFFILFKLFDLVREPIKTNKYSYR